MHVELLNNVQATWKKQDSWILVLALDYITHAILPLGDEIPSSGYVS